MKKLLKILTSSFIISQLSTSLVSCQENNTMFKSWIKEKQSFVLMITGSDNNYGKKMENQYVNTAINNPNENPPESGDEDTAWNKYRPESWHGQNGIFKNKNISVKLINSLKNDKTWTDKGNLKIMDWCQSQSLNLMYNNYIADLKKPVKAYKKKYNEAFKKNLILIYIDKGQYRGFKSIENSSKPDEKDPKILKWKDFYNYAYKIIYEQSQTNLIDDITVRNTTNNNPDPGPDK